MELLAKGQSIDDKDHEQNHIPTFHWTDAEIDKSINGRVANANKPKAQAKPKQTKTAK